MIVDAVPRDVLDEVLRLRDARGAPADGVVSIAVCVAGDGSERVLAAIQGHELSNDHYAYRELVAACVFVVVR